MAILPSYQQPNTCGNRTTSRYDELPATHYHFPYGGSYVFVRYRSVSAFATHTLYIPPLVVVVVVGIISAALLLLTKRLDVLHIATPKS